MQKQFRVDVEWEELRKGNKTGLEFEALFEEASATFDAQLTRREV